MEVMKAAVQGMTRHSEAEVKLEWCTGDYAAEFSDPAWWSAALRLWPKLMSSVTTDVNFRGQSSTCDVDVPRREKLAYRLLVIVNAAPPRQPAPTRRCSPAADNLQSVSQQISAVSYQLSACVSQSGGHRTSYKGSERLLGHPIVNHFHSVKTNTNGCGHHLKGR